MSMNGTDEADFPYSLLLIVRKTSNVCKLLVSHLSVNVKLSKLQTFKIVQLGGFLDKRFWLLLKIGLQWT